MVMMYRGVTTSIIFAIAFFEAACLGEYFLAYREVEPHGILPIGRKTPKSPPPNVRIETPLQLGKTYAVKGDYHVTSLIQVDADAFECRFLDPLPPSEAAEDPRNGNDSSEAIKVCWSKRAWNVDEEQSNTRMTMVQTFPKGQKKKSVWFSIVEASKLGIATLTIEQGDYTKEPSTGNRVFTAQKMGNSILKSYELSQKDSLVIPSPKKLPPTIALPGDIKASFDKHVLSGVGVYLPKKWKIESTDSDLGVIIVKVNKWFRAKTYRITLQIKKLQNDASGRSSISPTSGGSRPQTPSTRGSRRRSSTSSTSAQTPSTPQSRLSGQSPSPQSPRQSPSPKAQSPPKPPAGQSPSLSAQTPPAQSPPQTPPAKEPSAKPPAGQSPSLSAQTPPAQSPPQTPPAKEPSAKEPSAQSPQYTFEDIVTLGILAKKEKKLYTYVAPKNIDKDLIIHNIGSSAEVVSRMRDNQGLRVCIPNTWTKFEKVELQSMVQHYKVHWVSVEMNQCVTVRGLEDEREKRESTVKNGSREYIFSFDPAVLTSSNVDTPSTITVSFDTYDWTDSKKVPSHRQFEVNGNSVVVVSYETTNHSDKLGGIRFNEIGRNVDSVNKHFCYYNQQLWLCFIRKDWNFVLVSDEIMTGGGISPLTVSPKKNDQYAIQFLPSTPCE